jgi:hypothetical protein
MHPFAKTRSFPDAPVESLLLCPQCKIEMCLLGIEAESDKRDLYTFECTACGGLEVRGARLRQQVSYHA